MPAEAGVAKANAAATKPAAMVQAMLNFLMIFSLPFPWSV
jgi:hypothetical protein